MRRIILLLVCLPSAVLFTANAQVVNNNISNRSELILDEGWLHSNTSNNSVEWRCVNKALTNKCLVYHNDQWFHFTPVREGKFFVNISSQQCKKSEGVQLVIIEGNPCEISTYRIVACIPRISQEDVFLQLDSLKANTQYLVNVDGFLGDFCEFDIEFSSRPKGFPQQIASDTLTLKTKIERNVVWLQWRISQTEGQELQRFEIFVKKDGESRSRLISQVQVQRNALGSPVEEYFAFDTLYKAGDYEYQIVGVSQQEMRGLLSGKKISFVPEVAAVKEINALLPLSFTYPGRVEVHIFDSRNGEMLNYSVQLYQKPGNLPVSLSKFVQTGIREFQIGVRHNKSNNSKVFDIRVSESDVVEVTDKSAKN